MSIFPNITKEQILQALDTFDRELRPTPEWTNWSSNENFKYAIFHNFNIYPVKQIVSIATGVSRDLFSGGDQANKFVIDKGILRYWVSIIRRFFVAVA